MSLNIGCPAVLVVDDDLLIQFLVRDVLEDAGYRIILASNYFEAVSTIDSAADGIIGLITDINLGQGNNGWDIAAAARERIPALPVIYMTGASAHEWPAQGVPQSVLISKPFAPAQIVAALAKMTELTDRAHSGSELTSGEHHPKIRARC